MTATNLIQRSAIESRVLDLLAQGPLTAAELIRETGLTYNVLYTLLERLIDLREIHAEEAKSYGIRGKARRRYIYVLVMR